MRIIQYRRRKCKRFLVNGKRKNDAPPTCRPRRQDAPSLPADSPVSTLKIPRLQSKETRVVSERDERLPYQETRVFGGGRRASSVSGDARHPKKRRASFQKETRVRCPQRQGTLCYNTRQGKKQEGQMWGQPLRISYAILDQYPSDADQLVRVTSAMLSG